ncbi:S49 family peptidase, partial [Neptunomonas phycophila]
FASELIRNEVDALQKAGKPVVVSMSSVAASGGYWISSSADKIIANPTTITGSIGIFAVMTTFEKGLNKLGIYNDGVGT